MDMPIRNSTMTVIIIFVLMDLNIDLTPSLSFSQNDSTKTTSVSKINCLVKRLLELKLPLIVYQYV